MAKAEEQFVEFPAQVAKVQTLADGGIRATLDLPEQATAVAKVLMDWRSEAVRVRIVLEEK